MDKINNAKYLSEKVKVSNGTIDFIFTHLVNNNNEYYRCNICDVTIDGSISKHIIERKHQQQLAVPIHSAHLWSELNNYQSCKDFKLEPMENNEKNIAEIQSSLDKYNSGPLIGLGYLIELTNIEDNREPQYICLLCDKRGDPRTVMAHLISFNHRITYLSRHFPTAYRILFPYMKQFRRNVAISVSTICENIENKFGRMKPQVTEKNQFENQKMKFIENIQKKIHPSERMSQTFEKLINLDFITSNSIDVMKEVQKFEKQESLTSLLEDKQSDQRELSPISSVGSLSSLSNVSSDINSRSRSRSRSRSCFRFRSQSRSYEHEKYFRQSTSRDYRYASRHRFNYSYNSRSRTPCIRYRKNTYYHKSQYINKQYCIQRFPWNRPDYEKSKTIYYLNRLEGSNKNYIRRDVIVQYRKECKEINETMANILIQHEENPEKHPMYPEEWKIFWNKRYKELQLDNIDPTKYDFKPEWIKYWNKRMNEMHEEEIKLKQESLRKRLNLTVEDVKSQCLDVKNINSERSSSIEPVDVNPTNPNFVDNEVLFNDTNRNRLIDNRPHSPWESDTIQMKRGRESKSHISNFPRNYYETKQYNYSSNCESKTISSQILQNELDSEINVISVLRLLTALENKLGSLGPRVINLLSQALTLEKSNPNSAETLLDDEANCLLFETVKEKLKGQLLADLVEVSAERTFKIVVQKIATLLHYASERKKETKTETIVIPGVGSIAKETIARQISSALIAQGKIDVTQTELEQLIKTVVGMAKINLEKSSEYSNLIDCKTKISALQTLQSNSPKQDLFNGQSEYNVVNLFF